MFPQPVEDRRRVRAILPYTKVPDTDEIRYVSVFICPKLSFLKVIKITNRNAPAGFIINTHYDILSINSSFDFLHTIFSPPLLHGRRRATFR